VEQDISCVCLVPLLEEPNLIKIGVELIRTCLIAFE